jgi:hypothetical protein
MSVPQPLPDPKRKLITNTRRRNVQKGNMKDPGGWLHAPAMLEIFRTAEWKLEELTELREGARRAVERLRASRFEGDKRVYLYPTDAQDVDGIELKRYRGKVTVNLIEFLIEGNLTVPTGYKELYDLVQVGKESPVGHALVMDLEKPRDRAPDKRKTKSAATGKKSQSTGTSQSTTTPNASTTNPNPSTPAPEKGAPDKGAPEAK